MDAELHRVEGELLRADIEVSQSNVEKHFLKALDIARNQCSRSLELRASISLWRLWIARGESEMAKLLLVSTCSYFLSAIEAADFKTARGLIGNLSCPG